MLEMTKESSLMIVTYVNNDQMKLKTNFNQSYINVENFQIDLLSACMYREARNRG